MVKATKTPDPSGGASQSRLDSSPRNVVVESGYEISVGKDVEKVIYSSVILDSLDLSTPQPLAKTKRVRFKSPLCSPAPVLDEQQSSVRLQRSSQRIEEQEIVAKKLMYA
ncbi:hypothetical protein C1H76_7446 [Elsinoe australis]|uniref:Uncharacterized protein n=1 Tax=Elsinoe australis TaxID=40998 RepID=A0A4U7AUL6_9PEZI|nr:hypothetical protein C1H76_7446 [Elsinoe australis]